MPKSIWKISIEINGQGMKTFTVTATNRRSVMMEHGDVLRTLLLKIANRIWEREIGG